MGGADAHLVSALADTRLVASLWVALLGTGSHVRPQRCSVDTTETVDKRERRGETDRQTERERDRHTDTQREGG